MNEIILKQAQKFEKEYKEILENIKKFDKIAVFRHIMPDFDALGTQFGLATWLKDNFKDKDIKILGDNHVTFTPKGLYPETDKVNDSWFNDDFLAIIVDVGDEKRIADPRFKRAKFTIKLDHHPETDKIFNISVVDTSLCAASELVTNMLLSFGEEYTLTKEAASYFYSAIVGDSGRFLFGSTSRHTFEISSELLARNIQIVPLYEKMYEKGIDDLKFMQFVLNNFKITPEGTAYYVLTQKDLLKRIHNIYDKHPFDALGFKIITKDGDSVNPFPVYDNLDKVNKAIDREEMLLKIYNSKFKRFLLRSYSKFKRFIKKPKHLENANCFMEDVALHGCAIIFSKRYYEKYKDCFYSHTFLYHEEEFLDYRRRKDNLKFIYDPDIEIFHKEGSSLNYDYNDDLYRKLIFREKNILKSLHQLKQLMEEKKE